MITAVVAVVLVLLGFAVGAGGSAYQTRQLHAEPWREMRVEHEGTEGMATRTLVTFDNSKVALQSVEVTRDPNGNPELAHVLLRDGVELTARFESGRPTSLEGPDGSRAAFAYKGSRARIAFLGPDGKKVGDKTLTVPVELRSALKLAQARSERPNVLARLWEALADGCIGQAWAQDKDDPKVTVRRDVVVGLTIQVPNAKASDSGRAEVEASCPPYTCLPATPDVQMPGASMVRVSVSAAIERSKLKKLPNDDALDPYRKDATEERHTAAKVLPDVAAAVAAVGVTARACKSLKLSGPLCVAKLAKSSTAGGAITSLLSHEVETKRLIIDQRAEKLYYQAQARAALDRETSVQVCVSRIGYARTCTQVPGRPFAEEPMAEVKRSLEVRRGIGGTLAGSFVMTQSDGPDCKFSPSPKTSGTLRLTFDNEKNTATATLKASGRGMRPNLTCSMGTANMSWSQNYTATMTQTFTAAQLQSGGKLPLRLTGTMSGSGAYSSSNCRTRSGASVNCPAGKSDSYTYRIELTGELDLATQKGSGRLVVHNAPLSTSGTWRIPAEKKP